MRDHAFHRSVFSVIQYFWSDYPRKALCLTPVIVLMLALLPVMAEAGGPAVSSDRIQEQRQDQDTGNTATGNEGLHPNPEAALGVLERMERHLEGMIPGTPGDPSSDQTTGTHEMVRPADSPDTGSAADLGGASPGTGDDVTWTFMFYNDADFTNGYDPFYDFRIRAYSAPNLDVLMLRDPYNGPAGIYHIEADHTATQLEDWGEVDMADYATLRDFLNYGMTNYPADRYLLTVYDHGAGWMGACIDDTNGGGILSMDDFQRAFAESGPIDIIAFTAPCLMGAFESVYELRDHVDVYIGSEELSGYIYWMNMIDDICDMLVESPEMSNPEIGAEIIRLIEIYNRTRVQLTMSATRTDAIVAVAEAIETLGLSLQSVLPQHPDDIALSRGMTKHFGMWVADAYSVIDIHDFAHKVEQMIDDPAVQQAAAALKTAMDEAVVASVHGDDHVGANGLTLYHPKHGLDYRENYETSALDFAADYDWPSYLQTFFDYEPESTLIVGPGPGPDNPPLARSYDPADPSQFLTEWTAYGVNRYGVNVVCGDPFGGGIDLIVTGPGPGREFGPHVRAFSGAGTPVPGLSFLAYGTHKYGVNVACGDIDGDEYDEVITGAGPGRVFGPHVRAFDFDRSEISPIQEISYFAYGTHKYGVNVACGDIDGDEIDEIITGAGPGAVFGPHVRAWNYDGVGLEAIPGVSFLAYGTHKYGVNVACGDIDGDWRDDIITGPGPGAMFGAHVRGWSYDGSQVSAMDNINFMAYPGSYHCGVTVAADNVVGDRRVEIITAPGPDPNHPARICVWQVTADGATLVEGLDFEAFSGMDLDCGGIAGAGEF